MPPYQARIKGGQKGGIQVGTVAFYGGGRSTWVRGLRGECRHAAIKFHGTWI